MGVSYGQDDFVATGLPDDFHGEITDAWFALFDYQGRAEEYGVSTALFVEITPDVESGFDRFVETYNVGTVIDAKTGKNVATFLPSVDDKTPIDVNSDDLEQTRGPFLVSVRQRKDGTEFQLSNSSKFFSFMDHLNEAGFDSDRIPDDNNIAGTLIGTQGHFDRLDQKKRPGLKNETKKIVLISEVSGYNTSTGNTTATPAAENVELISKNDESLEDVVLGYLVDNNGEASQRDITLHVMKSFAGKSAGIAAKTVKSSKFLNSSDTWEYDANSSTLKVA